MCVEAAVCYAYDLPHSDKPPCVGNAVREFKIRLNDCNWSSSKARARGMRRIAIAQLGSVVAFVHTGGLFGLFASPETVAQVL